VRFDNVDRVRRPDVTLAELLEVVAIIGLLIGRLLLRGTLLGQKNGAEAEPLLLKGYEEMKQREKTIPCQGSTHIPKALDRLIEL
jgi:hypothetical protein